VRSAGPYVVALGTGAALSFAFPAPDLAPLAWVALIPILLLCEDRALKRGFGLGYVFGIGFFGTLLFWIVNVGYVPWLVLVLMQAFYTGLFGLAWAGASRVVNPVTRLLAPGLAWVALAEFVRSAVPIVGFTWGELSQSQHDLLWMLRPASIGGGWLVSFACVTCSALLAEAWRRRTERWTATAWVAGALALIAAPLLLPANQATGEPVRVGIVQGNVPEHWMGTITEKEAHILESHVALTRGLVHREPDLDLVVWPESSVALDPRRDPLAVEGLRAAATTIGAPMIVGGNEDVDADHYRVVTWLVNEAGEIVDTYIKTHLVPFGEYVPGRAGLRWLPMLDQVPRDAIADDDPKVFHVGGGGVAPVLSFEGDFGSLVRRRTDAGGRLLVVATNTSTWGRSWASIQHVAMSQVRAAENGVWVIHAALSGISAFVAPDGDVVAATPLWEQATLVRDLRFSTGPTFYARTGDWFPIGSLVVALALFVLGARKEPSAAGQSHSSVE
jgi:apolipoprotein N-acyltransferase